MQVSTFGVSSPLLQKHMEPPVVAHARGELQPLDTFLEAHAKANGGQAPTLLAGVDYLDRFKGVQLKLLAWERLLQHYPKYQRGHVLVQICLASRNQVRWHEPPTAAMPPSAFQTLSLPPSALQTLSLPPSALQTLSLPPTALQTLSLPPTALQAL